MLSRPLLELLLSQYPGRIDAIVALLLKFGLLVAVQGADEGGELVTSAAQQEAFYLVPSLLSPVVASASTAAASAAAANVSRCVLVLSLEAASFGPTKASYSPSEIKRDALLPAGLFMRLLGRAVAWSQQTSGATVDSMYLSTTSASLVFGSQNFKVMSCGDDRFISVDIQGRNPSAVLLRLIELIDQTLAECMPILRCTTLLPLSASSSFVPLELVRKRQKDRADLRLPDGTSINESELKIRYGLWEIKTEAFMDLYDIFLSYRWGTVDSDLTGKLFDLSSTYAVGRHSRAPVVFLDRERLKDGLNFKEEFTKALVRSSVVVPVVTRAALFNMTQHDAGKEDNVLLEWIMALECLASADSRVQRVFPIAFDEASPNPPHAVSSFFAAGLLSILSDAVPTATVARAAALLRANGVEPRPEMMALTVKGVVSKLMESLCIQLDQETANPLLYAKAACRKVMEALVGCYNIAELDPVVVQAPIAAEATAACLSASNSQEKLISVLCISYFHFLYTTLIHFCPRPGASRKTRWSHCGIG